MRKDLIKKLGIALGAIALFLALSYGFVPQVLEGKIVNQSDISGYVGMSHEMTQWNKAHPDNPTYWTDSMFGGMPTTAISTQNKGDYTQWIYDALLTGKRPATYLFIALLGAFLLFLALGVSWPLALGGAVAVAFCSYNFQIIQVGHNTKMQAIAFMPWVLAALVFTYRSAYGGEEPLRSASLRDPVRANAPESVSPFGTASAVQLKVFFGEMRYDLHGAPGTVLSDGKTYFAVATQDGAIAITDLQLSGKKRMDVKSFLLGFRNPTSYVCTQGTSKAEIAKAQPVPED